MVNCGLTVSITVTVKFLDPLLPVISLAVSDTIFAPKLLHVKLVWLNILFTIEQLSVLALSAMASVKLAVPLAPKYKLTFARGLTIGLTVSNTLIVTFAVLLLLLKSVTVNIILLVPKSAQVNVDLLIPIDPTAQLSVLLLFTWAAVMVAVPALFK